MASSVSTCGAVAVLAASTLMARTRRVSPVEEALFRTINDAPNALHPVVWPVMQAGSLGAVFAAATAVHRRARDPRRTLVVTAAGVGVWGGVKLFKPLAGRARPAALLDRVNERGAPQTGLGYPSGHAAVAATLGILTATSPRSRAVALAGAALTGWSRIYVGAHLPLDVAGGLAIGWLVGSGARAAESRAERGLATLASTRSI